jgi:hypothetical protein
MQLVLPATSIWDRDYKSGDTGKWPFQAYGQMLAGNNISLGRVVTKMQFDTKSATPKLLFSPVEAVSPMDAPKIKDQAESEAAAQAVEMKFFKKKDAAVESPAPAAPPPAPPAGVDGALPEPRLRRAEPKTGPATDEDVPEVLKKWQGKK